MADNNQPIDFNLNSLAKDKAELPEKPELSVEDARHQSMHEVIKGYAKPVQQKNMTSIYVDYKTRESSIVLVMCPEWAPEFSEFPVARSCRPDLLAWGAAPSGTSKLCCSTQSSLSKVALEFHCLQSTAVISDRASFSDAVSGHDT